MKALTSCRKVHVSPCRNRWIIAQCWNHAAHIMGTVIADLITCHMLAEGLRWEWGSMQTLLKQRFYSALIIPMWRLAQMKASVAGKENNEVIKFRVHGAWVPQGPWRCPTGWFCLCVYVFRVCRIMRACMDTREPVHEKGGCLLYKSTSWGKALMFILSAMQLYFFRY